MLYFSDLAKTRLNMLNKIKRYKCSNIKCDLVKYAIFIFFGKIEI